MIAHSSLHVKTILLTLIPLSNEFNKLEIFNNSCSCQITVAEHIRHMLQQFCGPKTFPVYSQIPQTKKGTFSEYKHVLSRVKWLNIAANSEIAPTGSFFFFKHGQI